MFIFFGVVFFFGGCTTTPKKEQLPVQKSQKETKNKSNKFNYQKYIQENKISKKQKKREKQKQEYQKILKRIASDLDNRWKGNQEKSEKLYKKALQNYYEMSFGKGVSNLQKALEMTPTSKPVKELKRRLMILQNKKGVLLKESLEILEEEKNLFEEKRLAFLEKAITTAIGLYHQKKYKKSQPIFQKILKACIWAKEYEIHFPKLKIYEKQAQEYLKKGQKNN